ncbi:hypothetical protein C0Q70_14332 [Pomacea canaliculata]|uniref:Uncharacterized protein n=1 Tax=Pomacea canaliculata TaxID=400727 RepID=A0A2T7NZQ8_POMCA|nr:hypothetical protein C0Q70_14332 [Pomacea canaliculata]
MGSKCRADVTAFDGGHVRCARNWGLNMAAGGWRQGVEVQNYESPDALARRVLNKSPFCLTSLESLIVTTFSGNLIARDVVTGSVVVTCRWRMQTRGRSRACCPSFGVQPSRVLPRCTRLQADSMRVQDACRVTQERAAFCSGFSQSCQLLTLDCLFLFLKSADLSPVLTFALRVCEYAIAGIELSSACLSLSQKVGLVFRSMGRGREGGGSLCRCCCCSNSHSHGNGLTHDHVGFWNI